MKHITPNTPSAIEAIETAATGGRKVFKPDLLLHARRNDIAMGNGFTSWSAYKAVESAKAEDFMQKLLKGELE